MPVQRFGHELPAVMAAKPRGLIDTGAILALLDDDDRWHRACSEVFAQLPLPLATSVAVLGELFPPAGWPP